MTLVADNFLFVHVPRTGGSSIIAALKAQFPCNELPWHHTFTEMKMTDRFSFGFVRNPWDRCLSMHYATNSKTDFASFLRADHPANRRWGPALCQTKFVAGINFIGRFERLLADFQVVCNQLNVLLPLPHIGRTDHGNYQTYYTDETRELVSHLCAQDIETFGYEF
jgi:hypothetical protein